MAGWIESNLNGSQWAQFLQKSATQEAESAGTGTLNISGDGVTVKLIKSESSEAISLSLDDIISVSKQKLEELTEAESSGKSLDDTKEIVNGLCNLKEKLQQIVEEKGLYGTGFQTDVMFFGDDLEEVVAKYKTDKSEKELLTELTMGKSLELSQLDDVSSIIQGNRNHLFNLSDYGESFFDFTRENSTEEFQIALAIDVLMNLDTLEADNKDKFKEFLFQRFKRDSMFETLMKREDANEIFDQLLLHVDDEELNKDKNKFRKQQVLNFAYSPKRYSHSFLSPGAVSSSITSRLESSTDSWKLQLEGTLEGKYGSGITRGKFETWRSRVMSSSTTVSAKSKDGRLSSQRWIEAQRYISSAAAADRGSTEDVGFDLISVTHKKLAEGEKGIKNPGKLRDGIVRTSGGWTALYPPRNYLGRNMEEFMKWFNEGLQQCEKNEKNPVLHAAETYQRLVSLHPFENGNGRISRLLMGYVLERFDIPPPILNEEKGPAVFPLKRTQVDQNVFLETVIQGIEESNKYFT